MKYSVELTARARKELAAIVDYLVSRSATAAQRWHRGIVLAMRSLNTNPQRFGLARESNRFPLELRQMLYGRKGSYRVVYTICDSAVVVLTIRHAVRRDLDPGEASQFFEGD